MREWVQLRFNRTTPVKVVALVPAVDPQGNQGKSYGFPRRFRIEFRAEKDGEVVHLIDHTQSDFEDPGIAPVIFDHLELRCPFHANHRREGAS